MKDKRKQIDELNQKALQLLDHNLPKTALKYLLKVRSKLLKDVHNKSAFAAVINNIGRAKFFIGDYPESINFLKKALKLKREIGNDNFTLM